MSLSRPNVAFGALGQAGSALVTSINAAEQQGGLSTEDGQAVYKAAKATAGGTRAWWVDVGVAAIGGITLGYLVSNVGRGGR